MLLSSTLILDEYVIEIDRDIVLLLPAEKPEHGADPLAANRRTERRAAYRIIIAIV